MQNGSENGSNPHAIKIQPVFNSFIPNKLAELLGALEFL
jgi:hypothetical protein